MEAGQWRMHASSAGMSRPCWFTASAASLCMLACWIIADGCLCCSRSLLPGPGEPQPPHFIRRSAAVCSAGPIHTGECRHLRSSKQLRRGKWSADAQQVAGSGSARLKLRKAMQQQVDNRPHQEQVETWHRRGCASLPLLPPGADVQLFFRRRQPAGQAAAELDSRLSRRPLPRAGAGAECRRAAAARASG